MWFASLPIHVIQSVDHLIRDRARLGVIQSWSGHIDIAERNILPIREQRRIFRPIQQVCRSSDAQLRRSKIVCRVRHVERAVNTNDARIFRATTSLPGLCCRDDGPVQAFEVDTICAPGEADAADQRLILCSVEQKDGLVEDDGCGIVEEGTFEVVRRVRGKDRIVLILVEREDREVRRYVIGIALRGV